MSKGFFHLRPGIMEKMTTPVPNPLPRTCVCGRAISHSRRLCLRCLNSFQKMISDGFCPTCAAKVLDHHLHPTSGPAYYDWLLLMLQSGKDADTGHKLDCPNHSLILRSDQPFPEIENIAL